MVSVDVKHHVYFLTFYAQSDTKFLFPMLVAVVGVVMCQLVVLLFLETFGDDFLSMTFLLDVARLAS